ncbi:MAG TPA: phosphate ABC transporter substrate-binding protein [Thermodesulfobacteriota bacterium]|nr:phosphate ABC transporter substrate-binding protein [Thermodesulfobacteriota bacterium]
MRHLRFFTFLILLLPVCIACQKSKSGITVAGSTSVQPFAELLAEEYMTCHPETRIYVQGGGSSAGIEAVRTHAAQIGMSSRSLTGEERCLKAVTIAKDAIAVIVHPDNPVRDLSLEQVRQIFAGKEKSWHEVNGKRDPFVLVTREEGSGTREAFQKLVMGEKEMSMECLVQDSNGAIRQVVASDPRAIGYISLGLVDASVRAVNISGVEPNTKNIGNGSYTLVRPFLFVFSCEPVGPDQAFLKFVLSPSGQALLCREGLVSVTPAKQQL